jgi:hypothetical protein
MTTVTFRKPRSCASYMAEAEGMAQCFEEFPDENQDVLAALRRLIAILAMLDERTSYPATIDLPPDLTEIALSVLEVAMDEGMGFRRPPSRNRLRDGDVTVAPEANDNAMGVIL